jgi:hypothetical protein
MKTSGVSSRGEFKTIGVFEFVEVTATGGGFEFVELAATVGVLVSGISFSQAARNDAARINEDTIRKLRREELFLILLAF